MRVIPRSIHGRMLALSVLATLVALAVAGAAIAGVLQRFVTQGLDQRLDAELSLLAGAVGADGRIDRAKLTRLRGLLDAGPEWRWQIVAPTGAIGSDVLADLDRRPPFRGGPHGERPPLDEPGRPYPLDAVQARGTGLHARQIILTTSAGPVTLTAAAPRDVVARPIRAAILPLLATLAILGVLLGIATAVQLRIGLRPLRTLRDGVAAMRRGAGGVSEEQPEELRPLAQELNALARDTSTALATARASAANLAHALKTPVATLALAVRDDAAAAAQVARIDATIRHHLSRARSVAVDRRASTALEPALADLASTIMRLHAGRAVAITRTVQPGLMVAVDAADLDELAGNLIDNAMRHAVSAVRIDATAEGAIDGGRIRLRVADDGPGIAAADRARATAPGVRLDERDDGHGFGLAIARELAVLHGGALVLEEAPGGGLTATVTLPIAGAR